MIHINNMMSPSRLAQRSWGLVAVAGVKLVGEVGKGIKANSEKRKAKKANKQAKVEMDKAMDKYRNMDTSNPYLNMENTMEDLTVNTQAAEMANQQNQIGMALFTYQQCFHAMATNLHLFYLKFVYINFVILSYCM